MKRSQGENFQKAARDLHAVHSILPGPDPSQGSWPVSTVGQLTTTTEQ
jgi:hypothetical protein